MRTIARSLGVALLGLGVFAFAPAAYADSTLALDLDYARPIKATGIDSGFGGAVRFGYQFHVPMLAFTPELALAYHKFGGAFDPSILRGMVGARLGIGELIRPGVFAHYGYGHMAFFNTSGGAGDPSRSAASYDIGGFLDLTVLPIIDLGVHGAYNAFSAGDGAGTFKYATVGAHLAITF